MSFLTAALPAIGSIVGGFISGHGARSAANSQIHAAQAGIDETRTDLSPWSGAGKAAVGQQMDILGLNGDASQQQVIDMLMRSPQFNSLIQQGETGILQNGSATGGLRGGDIQHSLANFRTDTLSSLINQQYDRLGGVSAQGLGASGTLAQTIASLLGQQGAARAGGQLATAGGLNQSIGGLSQLAGSLFGKGGPFMQPPPKGF